jgi:hypothetical protein
MFDSQTILMLPTVGWFWCHTCTLVRASNDFIFQHFLSKNKACDTPVMTYLALYIVPIPETASMRWCMLCGAEGTSEEFNLFVVLLNALKTPFIFSVCCRKIRFDRKCYLTLGWIWYHMQTYMVLQICIFFQDFWFGFWFLSGCCCNFVWNKQTFFRRIKSRITGTIDIGSVSPV